MQIGEKRTTLKDNAALYNHDSDKMTEREKFQSLSTKGKWIQFKQYYLPKIIAIAVIAAFVVSLLYTMLKPRKEVVLKVAIADYTMSEEMIETIQKGFEEILAIDAEKQETVFDNSFFLKSGDYQQMQRYTVMLYASELSIITMPLSVFEEMAPNGHFCAIGDVLPTNLYLALTDRLVMSGTNDSQGETVPDSEKAYGILLDGSKYYEGFEYQEPVVLVIPASWKNMEICVDFIEFLLK